MLNHRGDKYIKQRSHHSILLTTLKSERKDGNWVVWRCQSDTTENFYIFSLMILWWKVKRNSIREPYAMPKGCPYGCSILSCFLYFFPSHNRERRTFCSIIRVMIHQPASSFYEAQTGEFILEAAELLKLRETITRVYVQRTGNPLWVVSEDMERDIFMSATEAQAHGIVDLVAVE